MRGFAVWPALHDFVIHLGLPSSLPSEQVRGCTCGLPPATGRCARRGRLSRSILPAAHVRIQGQYGEFLEIKGPDGKGRIIVRPANAKGTDRGEAVSVCERIPAAGRTAECGNGSCRGHPARDSRAGRPRRERARAGCPRHGTGLATILSYTRAGCRTVCARGRRSLRGLPAGAVRRARSVRSSAFRRVQKSSGAAGSSPGSPRIAKAGRTVRPA